MLPNRPSVSFFLLTLIALIVTPALLAAQEWGMITPEEAQMEAPEDYPEAEALVLFDIGKAVAELRGLELTRHVRIKVLKQEAIDKILPVIISARDYDYITDVKAHILKPSGEVRTVGPQASESGTGGRVAI